MGDLLHAKEGLIEVRNNRASSILKIDCQGGTIVLVLAAHALSSAAERTTVITFGIVLMNAYMDCTFAIKYAG